MDTGMSDQTRTGRKPDVVAPACVLNAAVNLWSFTTSWVWMKRTASRLAAFVTTALIEVVEDDRS